MVWVSDDNVCGVSAHEDERVMLTMCGREGEEKEERRRRGGGEGGEGGGAGEPQK